MKCIGLIDRYDPVGFYDPDETLRARVQAEHRWKAFESAEELIAEADIVDIVTPTTTHFELAATAMRQGKHVFIEKPVTHTLEEAEELLALRDRYGVKVQVGHVERFNPAVSSIDIRQLRPMFIEVHRLAPFNPRGTDVSVVLDLMIHDIDIVLNIVDSPVSSIQANGVAVVSSSPDIANARVEFENGCVANITASRISMKQMRKMRFFQSDAYISLDFLEKKAEIIRLHDEKPDSGFLSEWDTGTGKRYIQVEFPEIHPNNAIKQEVESFLDCILNGQQPTLPLEDGYNALKVAYAITDEIEQRIRRKQSEGD
jgi:predicted dehydrogenase